MASKIQVTNVQTLKRAASANLPTPRSSQNSWLNMGEAIEGCGHLQRLILQYGKQHPHVGSHHSCEKPQSPCFHFSYSNLPSFASRASDVKVDPDDEIVDEMIIPFPRHGDFNDYISQLKVNTRRSTPLHWLEPEDKVAIHDINTKLRKAFKEASYRSPRPISAVEIKTTVPPEDKNKDEKISAHVPRSLIRPQTARPMPRLAVAPCDRCARRHSSASKRPISRSESPFVVNIVEACIGPSPSINQENQSVFFLNALPSLKNEHAPPPSPNFFEKEHMPMKGDGKQKGSGRHLAYTGFVQSSFGETWELFKQMAEYRRKEKATKLDTKSTKPSKLNQSPYDNGQTTDEEGNEPIRQDLINSSISRDKSPSPILRTPTPQQISFPHSESEDETKNETEQKSPRTVIILGPGPQTPAKPKLPKPAPPHSARWIEKSITMRSTSQTDSKRTPSEDTSSSKKDSKKEDDEIVAEKEKVPEPTATAPQQQRPRTAKPPAKPVASTSSAVSVKTASSSAQNSQVSSQVRKERVQSAVSSNNKAVPNFGRNIPHSPTRPNTAVGGSRSTASAVGGNSDVDGSKTGDVSMSGSRSRVGSAVSGAVRNFVEHSPVRQPSNADLMADMPDAEEVAKVKAELKINAEPIFVPSSVTHDSSRSDNGRLSPPLVHQPSPAPSTYKTLDEVVASNTSHHTPTDSRATSAVSKNKSNKQDVYEPNMDPEELERRLSVVKLLRPPPTNITPRRPKKPQQISQLAMEQWVDSIEKTYQEVSANASDNDVDEAQQNNNNNESEAQPEEENLVFVKSSERRPKKYRKDMPVRRRRAAEGARGRRRSSVMLPPGGFQMSGDGEQNSQDGEDENSDFEEDDDEFEEVDDQLSVESTPADSEEDPDNSSDIDKVEVIEENETWFQWTAMAAQLMRDIELLRLRLRSRSPTSSPISRRRKASHKNPKSEMEEEMTEMVRSKLLKKHHDGEDFLEQLSVLRTDIRREQLRYRRVAIQTSKRIAQHQAELELLRKSEQEMAAKYYEKRDVDRAQRQVAREARADQMKIDARVELDLTPDEMEIIGSKRDEAMMLTDWDMREFELRRIDNIEVEFEEKHRENLERREEEIDILLDLEEQEQRRLELMEEDILMGEIREQIIDIEQQMSTEQSILQANKATTDTKVKALTEKENELVNRRVDEERHDYDELAALHHKIASFLLQEESAEMADRERAEQDLIRRATTAIALREQRRRLAREVSVSPAFVYSYFRLAKLKKDQDNGRGKGMGRSRRPNTAFR